MRENVENFVGGGGAPDSDVLVKGVCQRGPYGPPSRSHWALVRTSLKKGAFTSISDKT